MSENTNSAGASGRARLIRGLLLAFACLGLVWAGWWTFFLRGAESTDDAYIAGNLVRVVPRVSGSVIAVFADNTQGVKAGQLLARLDDTDAVLALNRARHALAEEVRRISGLTAESARLRAVAEQRKTEALRAEGDYERRRAVRGRAVTAVSEEDFHHARDSLAVARMALRVAERQLAVNETLLLDTPLERQPAVAARAQQLREAWLEVQRCEIKSPTDGYIAKRAVQVGMHVTPGTPLMAVAPLHEVWVDANFKEVQLKDMRVGQKARVYADMYDSGVEFQGRVAGLTPGTGSSFSLLPPENATGNWIKVVQRVPVKILLDAEQLRRNPLLIGLSCTVSVDTSSKEGALLHTPAQSGPLYSTDVLNHDATEAEKEIRAIISANATAE